MNVKRGHEYGRIEGKNLADHILREIYNSCSTYTDRKQFNMVEESGHLCQNDGEVVGSDPSLGF
jgi:hypothetical protein